MRRLLSLPLLGLLALPAVSQTTLAVDAATRQLAHDVFKQLIEINTTDSTGSVTAASKAIRERLLAAGFPEKDLYLGGPNDRKQNLVVTYHGTGLKKPILFIGHLDVVEAKRSDWTTDPFTFVEKDGYYYGRGTQDMKDSDAILVTMLLTMKKTGYKPDRDLIVAFTADEEGGKSNGVSWLIKNQPQLMQGAFVLNPDGGGVDLQNGKAVSMNVDATEKLYGDYQLTVTNPGGHSSLPVPDNAIYHVADALGRLERYQFPFELNAITKAYFEKMAAQETGQKASDLRNITSDHPDPEAVARLSAVPEWNSMMHTTCVATRFDAGHANNALPQLAQAIVNCRILPGYTLEEIRQKLITIFDDPKVIVRYMTDAGETFDRAPDRKQLPPPAITSEVMAAMEKLTAEMWPGAPVVPMMATGASDSVYTNAIGLPSYGISGIAIEISDVRAHGRDERLPVQSFDRGLAFYMGFVELLSGGN